MFKFLCLCRCLTILILVLSSHLCPASFSSQAMKITLTGNIAYFLSLYYFHSIVVVLAVPLIHPCWRGSSPTSSPTGVGIVLSASRHPISCSARTIATHPTPPCLQLAVNLTCVVISIDVDIMYSRISAETEMHTGDTNVT